MCGARNFRERGYKHLLPGYKDSLIYKVLIYLKFSNFVQNLKSSILVWGFVKHKTTLFELWKSLMYFLTWWSIGFAKSIYLHYVIAIFMPLFQYFCM